MTVSSVSSSGASSSSSTSSTNTNNNSLNPNDFLSLLASELQNQDPLNATDTTQLMNQLMSYAGYEQQAEGNATLTTMSSTLTSIANSLDIKA